MKDRDAIARDLVRHLADKIENICIDTMRLVDYPDDKVGIAVSACSIMIERTLRAALGCGCPPEIIDNYRREVADHIVSGEPAGIRVGADGVIPMEEQ